MSISPESRISRIPRLAMAGAALLSMTAFKTEIKQSPRVVIKSETAIPLDPRLVNYTVSLSSNLIHASLVHSHAVEKVEAMDTQTKPTPAEIAASETTPLEFKEWSRVDVCEEDGNWHGGAPDYSGLGISSANWIKYGGEEFAPTGVQATPDEQIVVARRIQPNPPDQDGYCEPW